jgi:hypothetical protein
VRLTLVDSSAITLSVPRIADGVIVSPDGRAELDAVTVVETRKIDVLANVMPYGLALAAAGLVGWAVADEPEYKVPPLFPWRTRRDSSSTSEPAFSYAGPRPAASGPRPGGPDR